MPDDPRPLTMADLPAQRPAAPASAAEQRARFFNSANAFNVVLPPVPDAAFTAEPARALDPAAPTGYVACDLSAELGCAGPATTPFVLARYATIRPGETLSSRFEASGSIWYVIRGDGTSSGAGDEIAWSEGDIFLLPGGAAHEHRAGRDGAVLWVVTDEPMVAFAGLRAPAQGAAPVEAVHYTAAETLRQVDRIYEVAPGDGSAGFALIFSSTRHEGIRNIMPDLTLGLNSLPPGQAQRAHRHNSIAVTLVVEGERCWSMVDGRRKDWSPWATTVTPPGAVHSHHNAGGRRALFLIVQDGGLYYHARTMGFAFAE